MLDYAAASQPDTQWWIKGDGCDLVSGLSESVRMEWSGDVDLDDGTLQELYAAYRDRLNFIEGIGIGSSKDLRACIVNDLNASLKDLTEDKHFILTSKFNSVVVIFPRLYFIYQNRFDRC